MILPRLDLSHFTSGDNVKRGQLARNLLTCLTQHGFARIVNHGIPDKVIAELFSASRSFFALGEVEKEAIANVKGPTPQRGWSRVGAENSATLYRKGLLNSSVSETLTDAREHFDAGATNDDKYPNKWPAKSSLPYFRATMEQGFAMLESASLTIMEALEVGYGLPQGSFLSKITREENASEMRILRYPEISVEEIRNGHVSRIWPHFDLGVITLLFQDGVGGLEFENRAQKGSFHPVACDAQSDMIVNISETLQRWTNDLMPAGLHRVTVPVSMQNRDTGILPERFSITYFCKANRSASVAPLEQFVEGGNTTKYEEITAIDYHLQRLLSAY